MHAAPVRGFGAGDTSSQDRRAPARTRNSDNRGAADEDLTANGGGSAASAATEALLGAAIGAVAGPIGALAGAAAGVAGALTTCAVTAGPSYAPTGAIPVTKGGGRKRASFSMAAAFDPKACASCYEGRQYIKWDEAYHKSKGGPPHGGFPSTAKAGVWYEDRDSSDKRYGHRSGAHSDPLPDCGDEYRTGGKRDQAKGATYCGKDQPHSPDSRVGQYQFQLKVIDTSRAGAVRASSSVITVKWG